jgi:hypothetical protein
MGFGRANSKTQHHGCGSCGGCEGKQFHFQSPLAEPDGSITFQTLHAGLLNKTRQA